MQWGGEETRHCGRGVKIRWSLLFKKSVVVRPLHNQGTVSGQESNEESNEEKRIVRREYTKADVKELRAHSKAKTPVARIAKLTKRTEGSLRQKALKLGIKLGHRR